MAELRRTFDTAAERYDRIRPTYEPQIIDDFATLARLDSGSRILEIGCGTGQATVALAQRGYRVTAIELGARLARIARRNLADYRDVEIIVAPFEEWPLAEQQFDAVVSANAFHWIDRAVRVPKALEALRPGGSLAVIETWRRPLASEPVLARMRSCYEQWTSEPAPVFGQDDQRDDQSEAMPDIEASGLFDEIATRTYAATNEYSTAAHHQLLLTFSKVLALDAKRQCGLVACIDEVVNRDLGGRFVERAQTRLIVASKP